MTEEDRQTTKVRPAPERKCWQVIEAVDETTGYVVTLIADICERDKKYIQYEGSIECLIVHSFLAFPRVVCGGCLFDMP